MSSFARDLAVWLNQVGDDDDLRFPRQAIEDVIALFVMSLPADERGADDNVALLLGRFAQRAGLDTTAGYREVMDAVTRYTTEHPIDEAIIAGMGRIAQQVLSEGAPTQAALQAFMGERSGPHVLGGGGIARPAGSTAASPFARFAVQASVPARPQKPPPK